MAQVPLSIRAVQALGTTSAAMISGTEDCCQHPPLIDCLNCLPQAYTSHRSHLLTLLHQCTVSPPRAIALGRPSMASHVRQGQSDSASSGRHVLDLVCIPRLQILQCSGDHESSGRRAIRPSLDSDIEPRAIYATCDAECKWETECGCGGIQGLEEHRAAFRGDSVQGRVHKAARGLVGNLELS